jgi:hypothetical protein
MQQRAEQLLHRVIAEEGGEHHPDRRKVRDRRGRGGRDTLRGQPLNMAEGSLPDRPATIRVKRIPMDNTNAESGVGRAAQFQSGLVLRRQAADGLAEGNAG